MRRALLLLSFLVLWCAPARALTLSDIRTRIRTNIRDTDTGAGLQRYPDAVLTRMINEAQRDLVNQTWCLETSTSIVVTVGTTYYNLPSDLLAPTQARFRTTAGVMTEIDETARRKLLQDTPDFERNSGSSPPTEYFIQYSTSGGAAQQLGLNPGPSAAGSVLLDYYQQATDLSADSDVPLNGYLHLYPYHYALVYRVSALIRTIEGFPDAQSYAQLYSAEVAAIVNRAGSKPNYNPSFKGGKP